MKEEEFKARILKVLIKREIVPKEEADKVFKEMYDKELQQVFDVFLEVFNAKYEEIEEEHKVKVDKLEKELYKENE